MNPTGPRLKFREDLLTILERRQRALGSVDEPERWTKHAARSINDAIGKFIDDYDEEISLLLKVGVAMMVFGFGTILILAIMSTG